MEPVVRQLILKRFRSVPSEKIELSNPTFFVGQNGSGKTTAPMSSTRSGSRSTTCGS